MGMFGKGVYFAKTPLKSWQYSSRKNFNYILACDVALGKSKPARKGKNINPDVDLRRSWFQHMLGKTDYDSLRGLARCDGGSLNVPEYTIYRPERALPRF